jgi:effector-binding domain-containing protein
MITALIILVAVIVLWSAWGYWGSRVERAEYKVIKKMNGYEVREYPARIVAQTTVHGTDGEALVAGFKIVAGYIFGGNVKKESIAMTSPVVAEKSGAKISMTSPVVAAVEGDSQTVSFGMPRSYTLAALPVPNDPRVKIVTIPPAKYAVMRFSGYRSDSRIKRMQAKLLSALTRDRVTPQGAPAYAGYNAPWTPPWMTRHEVLVEIPNPPNLPKS